ARVTPARSVMSRMVTPENPLRANATRAASRTAWRVRSDLRRPAASASAAMAVGVRIETARPGPQLLEPRSLRRGQSRLIQVPLMLPDANVVRQRAFGGGQTLGECIGVIAD